MLNDSDVIAGCRARFDRFLSDPAAIPPDLRPDILGVVGRYADSQTWEKLHKLGLKTTSTEEKQYYYEALARAIDPQPRFSAPCPSLLRTNCPTSRAAYLFPFVAR